MTREQAVEARAAGRRVEWWDRVRGGWRRGVVLKVPPTGGLCRVQETGQVKGRNLMLDQLRPATLALALLLMAGQAMAGTLGIDPWGRRPPEPAWWCQPPIVQAVNARPLWLTWLVLFCSLRLALEIAHQVRRARVQP